MKIGTVGLDIAKQLFQAHGVDCKGKGGIAEAVDPCFNVVAFVVSGFNWR